VQTFFDCIARKSDKGTHNGVSQDSAQNQTKGKGIANFNTVLFNSLLEKKLLIFLFSFSGLDNSGKSSTVLKFTGDDDISKISPTLGFNILSLKYEQYTLNIWDIGGQQTIRSYWRNYFEETDGIVWVVDSSDRFRLNDCAKELHRLLKEEKLIGAPLLIFANKQDIPNCLSSEEISNALDLHRMSNSRKWCIVSSSAKSGKGLKEGINWLVKQISI
jgi:ADP-ribosylation factor-like protein 2